MSFTMSRHYARDSRSQRGIGRRLIRDLVVRETGRQSALDLGCGPGTLTAELAAALPRARVVGMDRSAESLAQARRASRGFEFVRGDFRRPPARLKGRFDLVFSNEALHWTPLPPRRLLDGRFFYRFLPTARGADYRRWAEARWLEGLRGVASLLAPGGRAIMQFGGHGQLIELFESMRRAFDAPELERARRSFRYPTYYPTCSAAVRLARRAGLRPRAVRAWTEPLAEKTPVEIVAFTRAFTEPALRELLAPHRVKLFYRRLGNDLRRERRRILWRHVLIVADR